MLRYLSKFLLDIMPSVVATVIGAWIVTHYVNPKTDAAQPKIEASAPKPLLSGASGMAPRNVEQVAVKPVVDEATEARKAAVREKPAIVKQAVAAPRVEEKREAPRDTTDLVRAALERQRNQPLPEAPHVQPAIQPVSAPVMVAAPPAPAPVMVPQVMAAPAPAALPPPIVIAPQREATAQPSPSLFGDMDRPTPPADIPVRSADASAQQPGAPEGRSLIGGIASAAKSLVDVVIPR